MFFSNDVSCNNSFFGMGWFMTLSLILIAGILYALIKLFHKQDANYETIEILNERFANGVISEEDYKKRKKMIKKS